MISFNKEQIFIVTGASSGIGEATAILLNKLGATVIGIGRNIERLEGMKAKCEFPENMFLEQKDLTEDIEELPKYVKALKEKYGKFAGLAYCAGMGGIQPIRAVEYEQIQKVFSVNYFAPVFMVKGMLDKRNNIGAGTSIVCVASAGGVKCDPGMTSYAGSKGALIASMESIAKEVASSKIRVNCVSPTLINTQMADDIARQYAEGKYPMGIGEVDDVANYIAFLLSDKTKWIAAKNYIIDCGVF